MRQPKPVCEMRPEVPEPMAAIVDKMLAKDPAQRFQAPAEVAQALAPWTRAPIPPPAESEFHRLSPAVLAGAAPSGLLATPISSPPALSPLARDGIAGLATLTRPVSSPRSPTANDRANRAGAGPATGISSAFHETPAPEAEPTQRILTPLRSMPSPRREIREPERGKPAAPSLSNNSEVDESPSVVDLVEPPSNARQVLAKDEPQVVAADEAADTTGTASAPFPPSSSAIRDSGEVVLLPRKQTPPSTHPTPDAAVKKNPVLKPTPSRSSPRTAILIGIGLVVLLVLVIVAVALWWLFGHKSNAPGAVTPQPTTAGKSTEVAPQPTAAGKSTEVAPQPTAVGKSTEAAFPGQTVPVAYDKPARLIVMRTADKNSLVTIKDALVRAKSGDHIVVQENNIDEAVQLTSTATGIRDITIEAEARNHKPVVWRLPGGRPPGTPILAVSNVPGLCIKGFRFESSKKSIADAIVLSGSCPGLTVQDCYFEGFASSAIRLSDCSGRQELPCVLARTEDCGSRFVRRVGSDIRGRPGPDQSAHSRCRLAV